MIFTSKSNISRTIKLLAHFGTKVMHAGFGLRNEKKRDLGVDMRVKERIKIRGRETN